MKDSALAIRTALVSKITALGYSVYDRVPKAATYPYVWIYNQTQSPATVDGDFGVEAFANVDIVQGYSVDYGQAKAVDDIATAIIQAVATWPSSYFAVTGYELVSCTLDGTNTIIEHTPSEVIYTKTIRFRFLMYES
jgi:hypothetical protein